jgi:glucose-1-phosphate adenylyltransferase
VDRVLTMLLAGGAGERLIPLSRRQAKPAVRFGGNYRLIDFTLSNCVNSGLRRIFCLTQYKALELLRHIREGWSFLPGELGEFIEALPPMQRMHSGWYLGTADAVYQNIASVFDQNPTQVLIVSGDHIYKMNYREMLDAHRAAGAAATVATLLTDPAETARFGVADIDPSSHLIRGFQEKPEPALAVRSTFDPGMVSVSMGVYIFDTNVLLGLLSDDAANPDSTHDFGRDILPSLPGRWPVLAFDFHDLNAKRARYWRDVGTLDAYYEANMDLISVEPEFNLYSTDWPVRTRMPQAPPAKFVFAQEGRRMGVAIDSLVSPGVIVSGGRVQRSVLSPGVRVNSYCEIEDSILLDKVHIGRYSRLRRCIVDEGTVLPEKTVAGEDPAADLERGWHVTEGGVTVIF